MIDPRDKRPSQDDLQDSSMINWLQTLASKSNWSFDYTSKTAKVLSGRELQVLQLIAYGFSTKDIADRLYLSAHTVSNHRKNMLSRSRCGNLAELVRIAKDEDLL